MIENHFPCLADISLLQMDLKLPVIEQSLLSHYASPVVQANIATLDSTYQNWSLWTLLRCFFRKFIVSWTYPHSTQWKEVSD